MAEPTNTDALHQGNESTEEMQQGPGAELLVEQRGPLLGRRSETQGGSASLLAHPHGPLACCSQKAEYRGLPAAETLSRVVEMHIFAF